MSDRATCVVPDCAIRDRHVEWGDNPCDGKGCPGCLPGLAMDGAQVCFHHSQQARRDLGRLPQLDGALTTALNPLRGTVLAQFRQHGGSKDPGLDLNPVVLEWREHIRERLASMVAYVTEERGMTGPTAWDVATVCAWLGRHHDWITASRMAGPYVAQLSTLTRKAYSLAYPSGTRRFEVCPCIEHTELEETGERLPCTGTLWAVLRPDTGLLPSELTCDTDEAHTYAPGQWMTLGRKLHGPTAIHPSAAARLAGKIGA